ncbi:hypothetical protein SKAU_G00390850 [Synaphobranchus kaupii]|uniref:Uncharacterized protein n=1 Tax=Synaphobranchus kaupii TaxID=118154 RepID=A0A9Q1IBK6_SYNKA|nr:hypothetical protein SKAU_G00390850 [Synaphobranchus kaupii]
MRLKTGHAVDGSRPWRINRFGSALSLVAPRRLIRSGAVLPRPRHRSGRDVVAHERQIRLHQGPRRALGTTCPAAVPRRDPWRRRCASLSLYPKANRPPSAPNPTAVSFNNSLIQMSLSLNSQDAFLRE